jgi:hypothetical protein
LIPDLVALRDRHLFIGEAKLGYDIGDREKLEALVGYRRKHLLKALETFAAERGFPSLCPVRELTLHPVLVFLKESVAPNVPQGLSYLRIVGSDEASFEGELREVP